MRSPIASTQLLIIAWFTGSRARRGALGPSALIFAKPSWMSTTLIAEPSVYPILPSTPSRASPRSRRHRR
ncbi:Uncharacterised protein [Mycobacteroides abscessus subsp. abscessus]|nr:Uncharacterised protein [Mycobacteroides abscessus subsp. abscessus]